MFSLTPDHGRRAPDAVLSFLRTLPHFFHPPATLLKTDHARNNAPKSFALGNFSISSCVFFEKARARAEWPPRSTHTWAVVRSDETKTREYNKSPSTLYATAGSSCRALLCFGDTNVTQDSLPLWVHCERAVEKTIFTFPMSRFFPMGGEKGIREHPKLGIFVLEF